jgi:hypothetical protein
MFFWPRPIDPPPQPSSTLKTPFKRCFMKFRAFSKKCFFDPKLNVLLTLTQTHKPTNYFFSYDPPFSRGNYWTIIQLRSIPDNQWQSNNLFLNMTTIWFARENKVICTNTKQIEINRNHRKLNGYKIKISVFFSSSLYKSLINFKRYLFYLI